MLRLASLALLVLAVPASAQTATQTDAPSEAAEEASAPTPLASGEVAPPVDPDIIGSWSLAEVEDAGPFARFNASIDAMAFTFTADGTGAATATIEQDGASYARESTFSFGCTEGAIVSNDHPTIHYKLLADGGLRLTDASGLAVRMARDASTASLR